MTKEALKKTSFESEKSREKTMIRFLFDDLKFRMMKSFSDFTLDTLSSKISAKSEIIVRLTNDVLCDILIDAIIIRHEKSIRRNKIGDLILFNTKNEEDSHIHEKHEKLIQRIEVLWKKDYESSEKRSEIAKLLWKDHQRSRDQAIEKYLSKMTKWIRKRHLWKYAFALQLFELDSSEVKWLTVFIERFLIEKNFTFKNFVITNIMLMTVLNEKENESTEMINEDSISISNIIRDASIMSHISSLSTKVTRTKRRKTDIKILLHEHLQEIIISSFTSMNNSAANNNDRNDLNQAASKNC